MAKRFTDTDKYKKPFVRGLKGPYKLLWDYLYHDCDNAGIWLVDFEIAQIYLGSDMPVTAEDALELFGEKVVPFDDGRKWYIPSFVEFQYGELNVTNRAHKSVIDKLEKYDVKGLTRSFQGRKDKDMDKEKVQNKDKVSEVKKKPTPEPPRFDEFWEAYGYKSGKNGAMKAWKNIDPEKHSEIILAAKDANSVNFTNDGRKMAQGWLNDCRWDDEDHRTIATKDLEKTGVTTEEMDMSVENSNDTIRAILRAGAISESEDDDNTPF